MELEQARGISITSSVLSFGYQVRTSILATSAGIIDPTKVARNALAHAASVAGVLLTTDVMVTELRDEQRSERGAEPESV